jgi:hypothetical protein
MNIWRILTGRLSIMKYPWNKFYHIGFSRAWGGRIFMLEVGKRCIQLDCRKNFLQDIATGKIR